MATKETILVGTIGQGVMMSSDDGESWSRAGVRVGMHSDAIVKTLLPDPRRPATVYAGTDLGLYQTDDGGGTWRLCDTPMKSVGNITPVLSHRNATSPRVVDALFSRALAITPLSRTTGSREGPSIDRHPHSARDAGSSNADPPRCRVEGPSTVDTECPDPRPRRVAGHRRPTAEGPRRGCCLRAARLCGRR